MPPSHPGHSPAPGRKLHVLSSQTHLERVVADPTASAGFAQLREQRIAAARASTMKSFKASLRRSASSCSSSSVKPGDTPASTGLARSRCAQNEWMVPAKKRSRFDSVALNPHDAVRRCRLALLFECELKAAAQFRRCLSRKRDGRHALDVVHAGGDTGGHAMCHLVRFAGTGARLDEQARAEVGSDAIARSADRRALCAYSCVSQPHARSELLVLEFCLDQCDRDGCAACSCEVAEFADVMVACVDERARCDHLAQI